MIITLIRTLIIYAFVVIALRLMGKRQIGELEASELVVTIIISDIAAIPITNPELPLITNVMAIFLLMILEILLSYAAYKSSQVRSILYGRPSTFFKNGRFDQKEMLRQRFNVTDIMEEVRNNGICTLDDVEFIVMETNGKVSVILKADKSPATPRLLNLKCEPLRMSYIIIDNGKLIRECMQNLGLNDEWVKKRLKENNLSSVSDVFYMSFEQNTGKTVIIPKESK